MRVRIIESGEAYAALFKINEASEARSWSEIVVHKYAIKAKVEHKESPMKTECPLSIPQPSLLAPCFYSSLPLCLWAARVCLYACCQNKQR